MRIYKRYGLILLIILMVIFSGCGGGGGTNPEKKPPVAIINVDKNEAIIGEFITFDSSKSNDPDGGSLTYSWDFGDGDTSSESIIKHGFINEDEYTVKLRVVDDEGESANTTITITIKPSQGKTIPVAEIDVDKNRIIVGRTVNFDGSRSYDADGGDITDFNWNFGDGNTAVGKTVSHAFSSEGTFSVTLTVTDNEGETGTKSISITTQPNQLPVARFTASKETVLIDESITFDASSSSDPDGDHLTYSWDFGNGQVKTGMIVTHQFLVSGSYKVKLTVTDESGAQATTLKDIVILNNSSFVIKLTYSGNLDFDSNHPIILVVFEYGSNTFKAIKVNQNGIFSIGTNALVPSYDASKTYALAVIHDLNNNWDNTQNPDADTFAYYYNNGDTNLSTKYFTVISPDIIYDITLNSTHEQNKLEITVF